MYQLVSNKSKNGNVNVKRITSKVFLFCNKALIFMFTVTVTVILLLLSYQPASDFEIHIFSILK